MIRRRPDRRFKALIALLPMLALACPCSQALELAGVGGARFNVPAANLKQLRFRTTLHQQYDFSCGSAALATLLTYHYGVAVSEQAAFEQMYLRGDQQKIRKEGFSLLDMQRYLASLGLRADGFELALDKLLEARLPAIVLIAENGYQHFVVIKGLTGDRVLLGDPASGTRTMPRSVFEAIWPSKLLFVIHGRQALAFNHRRDWGVAPRAPADDVLRRDSLAGLTLPLQGPGDF
jgi:predicted double-glycine peptidase